MLRLPWLSSVVIILLAAGVPRDISFTGQAQDGGRGLRVTTVSSLPARPKRFALIIGVDKYADTQITTLSGASNDAHALANALINHAGFPAEQVVVLASDEPEERQPTRGQILRRLSNLATLVPKDGLLLFSFAGHGIERRGNAYLLPSDAQVNSDIELLEMTAINAGQIRDTIQRTGARQVLMLLDACRNDPSAGRSGTDNPLTDTYRRAFDFNLRNRGIEAFATLYATAIGQRAYEYKEKKQGYFTWAVVEGLKGGAANERGLVSLGALVKFLQDRVPKQVALDLGAGKDQRPFADIEGYKADELVIATTTTSADVAGLVGSRKPDTETLGLNPQAQTESEKNQTIPAHPPAGTRQPDVKSRRSVKKAGRVLLLVKEGEGGGSDPFLRALSQKLAGQGLSVTTGEELSTPYRARIGVALQKLQAGDRKVGASIPFALVITSDIRATARPPYNDLFVCDAAGIIKAFDGDTGLLIALENVSDVRGFGNTQPQAATNALAIAMEKISATFIERVAQAAR